jgi:hypothetical protein
MDQEQKEGAIRQNAEEPNGKREREGGIEREKEREGGRENEKGREGESEKERE